MSTHSQTIPLRSPTGRILDKAADLAYILQNAGHFHLKRNKRNNITCAILKERSSLSPLSRSGEHYTQSLDSGHRVFALRGTPGADCFEMS